MTSINWVKGDLVELAREGRFDAVAHGCNCYHKMGAGIAPKLNKLTNGRLLREDKKTPFGDINKLGTVSYITENINGKRVEFFNLYTQFAYGDISNGEVYVHWESVLSSIMGMFDFTTGTEIGIPLIGCGLAGGKKDEFIDVIDRIQFNKSQYDIDLTIVEWG